MDKPLSDKENKKDDRKADGQIPSQAANAPAMPETKPDLSKEKIGAYTTNGAFDSDLSQKSWSSSKKAWSDTAGGRLAIRTVTRGIMGAAFFAVGGALTKKWLHPENIEHWYDPSKALMEQKNPLQFIAKLIDNTVGQPIEWAVKATTGDEFKAVSATHFRPTKFEYAVGHGARTARVLEGGKLMEKTVDGRSLGHEAAAVTFDFFCASIGDAWGRDIAALIDPNVKKQWIKDGHIDFPHAAKNTLKSVWEYVSYNGGEDWAVAIPYVYFMKGQRAVLNKFCPGFAYDSDRHLNGGSFKVDDHGKVVGTYAAVGAFDLQTRFMVYNVGTLMYRELYNLAGVKMQGKEAVLYGSPHDAEHQDMTLGRRISNFGKWVARSFIKGNAYMAPAVPFFWISRASQSKNQGLLIHPEHGVLANVSKIKINNVNQEAVRSLRSSDIGNTVLEGEKVFWDHYDNKKFEPTHWSVDLDAPGRRPADRWFSNPNGEFSPYSITGSPVDKIFNVSGKWGDQAVTFMTKQAKGIAPSLRKIGIRINTKNAEGGDVMAELAGAYTKAAISYTPYMYMKAESARVFDTGKIDYALENMIDGASHLNWGEFKTGVSDVVRAYFHKPLADPVREAEAQRRIRIDKSPSADVNLDGDGNDKNGNGKLGWRERIVTAEKKQPVSASKDNSHKNLSFAEQEDMRKALEQLTPPSNAIH